MIRYTIQKSLLKGLLLTALITNSQLAQAQQPLPPVYSNIPVNYIRTWDAQAPTQDGNALITMPLKDAKQTTQYVDGLGRPLQTVAKQGSMATGSTAVDMVSPVVYDAFGREQYKYLPFAASSTGSNTHVSDGMFKSNPFEQQQAFMQQQYSTQGETYYYSQTNYEPSPLNRVEKAMPAGNSWAGSSRGVEMKYWINTAADNVRVWAVTDVPGNFGTCQAGAAYAAGQLYKNVTVDEKGMQVIEFKNKEERVILKKVQFSAAADNGAGSGYTGWLSTYYIYDDFGNLRCVIQPEGVKAIEGNWQLTTTLLNEQCFRYEYDSRNRMIKKKVPGAGEAWMVYDSRDRLVLTQDANMRALGKWLYTQYDELNRPVATGLWNNIQDISYHATQAYNSTAYPNLTGQTYEELTHTYYDDYSWLATNGNPFANTRSTTDDGYFNAASSTYPYYQALIQDNALKGRATGTKTKVLGTATYLYSISYYDDKGRVIQAQIQNITGGTDITTTQYSWAGQPLIMVQRQQKGGTNAQTNITVSQLSYDDLGRLIKTEKKASNSLVNSGAMPASFTTTAQLEYDALGQIKTKKIGSKLTPPTDPVNNQIETITYDYNIRGWMLGMNRDYLRDHSGLGYSDRYFGFELGYDKYDAIGAPGVGFYDRQYNGNITGTIWKSKGDQVRRKYDFQYDEANRFGKGYYTQNSTAASGGSWNNTEMDFNVGGFDADNNWKMKYDDNGNILSMVQKGFKIGSPAATIDALRYSYEPNSNKLKQVTDDYNDNSSKLGDFKYDAATKTATDYTYDANGNMVADNNKKISSIIYNHLNLPQQITITSKGSIEYVYNATGNKLKKIVHETGKPDKTTLYLGGAVYEDDVLQFLPQEEGRIRFKPAAGTIPAGFAYDYFIKDHLGNVRMVLTDEQQIDKYPVASLEPSKVATEQNYYGINTANVVDKSTATGITNYINDNGIGNNPSDPTFEQSNSTKLYKLNSNTNKTGLGITLKVMTGDRIDVFGKSYYFQNTSGTGSNTAIPIIDVLNGFLTAPAGVGSSHGITGTNINDAANLSGINSMLSQQNSQSNTTPNKPKAFINVIFFDEQFKSYSYSTSMVGSNSVVKDHYADLQNIAATKSGYVYIYVSNESPVNVFFDNMQVVHTRGAILEESHYYPFGLKMDGISSSAAGGKQNKEKTFQGQRFDDELGLNWVQFKWRNHDPQIGRFIEIDPLSEKYVYNSTYAFSENHVTSHVELEGLEKFDINTDGDKQKEAKLHSQGLRTTREETTTSGRNKKNEAASKALSAGSPSNEHTGFGLYKPSTTLSFDVAAGGKLKVGPVGVSGGKSQTVIGIRDNEKYFMGRIINDDGSRGPQVTRTFAGAEFLYGVTNENVEKKFDDGTISNTQTTKTTFFIFSGETTTESTTGRVTESYNIDIGAAVGIGLFFEGGIKIPFYKKDK